MRQAAPKLVLIGAVLASGIYPQSVVVAQAQNTQPKKAEQKKKPEGVSLTGCVDQQEGQYVLVDDHDMSKVIANLDADGFPTEGFAKHVGAKVTVRGVRTSDTPRPVFKVRSIETVSETCTPQTTERGKI